jgi:TolB protein
MTDDDQSTVERRVSQWLAAHGPEPAPDLATRLLARTASVHQRRRARLNDLFVVRATAIAAVAAAAVIIGLGLATMIGPEPPVGTAPPSTTPPPATDEPTSLAPDPSRTPLPSPAAGAGRIVFQANRSNDTSGIYLMDAHGSNVTELADDPEVHELDPIWSPDGSLVSFTTMSADGSMQGGTFIVSPSGGEPELVDDNFAYGPAVWSPDGSMLALGGDGTERGIRVYRVGDAQLEALTDDGGNAPHWSPDGTRIAYNVRGDIRTVDVGSGEILEVTADEWNDAVARWSDGGQRLVFSSDRSTDGSGGSARSWVIDADGGEPELLGDGELIAFAHWPSPDGRWLAYAAPDGSGLRLSRADGSEDRAVHPTVPADRGPSWAPDSRAFVFSRAGEEPRDIFVMRVDAAEPEAITDHPADESAPNWGPPGA